MITRAGNSYPTKGTYVAAGVALADGQTGSLLFDSQSNLLVNPGALISTSDSVTAVSTIADGADVTQGVTTGAAVITDANGTVQQYVRGTIVQWAAYLARIPAALSTNGGLKVSNIDANIDAQMLAASARTTAAASADQTNLGCRGVLVVLNITAASGTGGLTLLIKGKDSVSNAYYQLNASPTAIIATGIYVYELYPGSSTAGSAGTTLVNQRTAGVLPRTWRINVNVGDASSYTYSVSAVTIV